ncbi:MAG: hypothetical protein CVU56_03215 [Deltaproteobacteria bacterium HGW-Deltaproteobacteria-14]|jgi:hypothetical protein|nr:MAG: hypothetical protein CVU56_03215 [Deltaproteobacteria bacterium HGW-Deltaproteobacteria-14]
MRTLLTLTIAVCGLTTSAAAQTVEVSAPLFPRVLDLYPFTGDAYPDGYDAQEALADDVLMTFGWLRDECAARGYDVLLAGDAPLTPEQRMENYNHVAECAYDEFTAKPYMVPQLVADVDVCALKLGDGWRLPTEADVLGWPDALFEGVADVLTETADGTSGWGTFYFSLLVYVTGADGDVRIANLHPDATTRVFDLPAGTDPTRHVEAVPFDAAGASGWAPPVVRCVRELPDTGA